MTTIKELNEAGYPLRFKREPEDESFTATYKAKRFTFSVYKQEKGWEASLYDADRQASLFLGTVYTAAQAARKCAIERSCL